MYNVFVKNTSKLNICLLSIKIITTLITISEANKDSRQTSQHKPVTLTVLHVVVQDIWYSSFTRTTLRINGSEYVYACLQCASTLKSKERMAIC